MRSRRARGQELVEEMCARSGRPQPVLRRVGDEGRVRERAVTIDVRVCAGFRANVFGERRRA